MKNKGIRNKYLMAVFLVWIFFSSSVYVWLKTDTRPLPYDQSCLFSKSLSIHDSIRSGFSDFTQGLLAVGIYSYLNKPTRVFQSLTSVLLFFLFGRAEDTALMANIFFVGLLLLFTYLICDRYLNRKIGFLSVLILSCSSVLFRLSVQYREEISAAAMVVISIYFLLRSDYFKHRIFSILFGITAGLGFLTKEIYPVFMIGPLCYVSFKSLTGEGLFKKRSASFYIFTNWFFALSLIAIIAGIWYIPHFNYVKFRILGNCFSEEVRKAYNLPKPLTLEAFIFYLEFMMNYRIPYFYFVIFCISTSLFYKGKTGPSKSHKNILMFWVVIPLLILTFTPSKNVYYYLPSYSAVAIIISSAVINIRRALLRRFLTGVMAALALLNFFTYRFYTGPLPRKEDWKARDIVVYLNKDCLDLRTRKGVGSCKVGLLFNDRYTSVDVFNTQALLCGISALRIGYVETMPAIPLDYGQQGMRNVKKFNVEESRFDYIITKTGKQGEIHGVRLDEKLNQEIVETLERSNLFERLPRQFRLPYDSQVIIFRKKAQ